jgi:alpha-beta hydrolase superfamily lysophospholipase
MSWNDRIATCAGVVERGFDLDVAGHRVPGVYWSPATGTSDRLVLLGHGGTTHKKAEYIESIAGLLARRGVAAMAIDGPGHGERAQSAFDANDAGAFARAWKAGGGTEAVIADWRAALDFIEADAGARPTGWWGLSMGTMMGLPVCASDTRIHVALLGLMGSWGPNGDDLLRLAPRVQCPVRFLVQWDDEIVPRDACLRLFAELGSKKKTLHANPGRHGEVPAFEIRASVEYLDQYLR